MVSFQVTGSKTVVISYQSPGLGLICQFRLNGLHPTNTVIKETTNVKSNEVVNTNRILRSYGIFMTSLANRSSTAIFNDHNLCEWLED